ncbi:MAG: glycosyltransferase family 4 protein [Oligoflexia bacterium]|nr:glycosyltransferase family 4 protein [Oligoflexia bacterium]
MSPSPSQRPLAFVIHDLNPWGGHDRSTLEIARRLSHRWPVEIYAFSLADPEGLGRWGKVRFHRIQPDPKRPMAARIGWFHAATLAPLRVLPRLRGRPVPLVHATGACALASDVVQVQFVNAAWEARQRELPEDVCARPYSRGASGLATRARRFYYDSLLRYNLAVERRVYSRNKTYIAIARSVAEELRIHFGITEHVHVIHHGVDSERFCPATGEKLAAERAALRARLGIAEDEIVALFVGAYERKGLAVAIDALGLLVPEARAKVRLLAVGGGATEGFLARARALGVEERVLLHGPTKDIAAFYRAAEIFVLPTLYEPFGLVIIEAMASGLAPLVSRLAGGSELLEDGKSGSLIEDPADAREVARRWSELLANPALRRKMAAESRGIAEARSWDRVADEYAAVLAPLLGGS